MKKISIYIPQQEYEVKAIQFNSGVAFEEVEEFIIENTAFDSVEFAEVVGKNEEVLGYALYLRVDGKQEIRAVNKNDYIVTDSFKDIYVMGEQNFFRNYIKVYDKELVYAE